MAGTADEMTTPSKPPFTQAPFGITSEKLKAVAENPMTKAASWAFSKAIWFLLLWGVWSAKIYFEDYVTSNPQVQENKDAIASMEQATFELRTSIVKVSDQQEQMQANQVAIADSLKQTSVNLAAVQMKQEVQAVRIEGLERDVRRATRTTQPRTEPDP